MYPLRLCSADCSDDPLRPAAATAVIIPKHCIWTAEKIGDGSHVGDSKIPGHGGAFRRGECEMLVDTILCRTLGIGVRATLRCLTVSGISLTSKQTSRRTIDSFTLNGAVLIHGAFVTAIFAVRLSWVVARK